LPRKATWTNRGLFEALCRAVTVYLLGISFLVGLPVGLSNMYGTGLSPLTDLSALTLSNSPATPVCQIAPNDSIYFKVTNPQSGNSETLPGAVSASNSSTIPN
jgi:hypothetical protein